MGFEILNEKNLKFRQILANKFKASNKSGLLTNLNDVGRTEMNGARTSSSCASGREEQAVIPRTSSYIFYILDT